MRRRNIGAGCRCHNVLAAELRLFCILRIQAGGLGEVGGEVFFAGGVVEGDEGLGDGGAGHDGVTQRMRGGGGGSSFSMEAYWASSGVEAMAAAGSEGLWRAR